eukprot:scaffold34611_cov184-Amphora_coffeaeformis.AAC.3
MPQYQGHPICSFVLRERLLSDEVDFSKPSRRVKLHTKRAPQFHPPRRGPESNPHHPTREQVPETRIPPQTPRAWKCCYSYLVVLLPQRF